jgi:hypothetical protein
MLGTSSTSTTASSAPGRSSTTRSYCDSTCTPGRRRPSLSTSSGFAACTRSRPLTVVTGFPGAARL